MRPFRRKGNAGLASANPASLRWPRRSIVVVMIGLVLSGQDDLATGRIDLHVHDLPAIPVSYTHLTLPTSDLV